MRISLVKYNSSGTLQWYRGIDLSYNSPLNARSESGVATDSDGNIYTLELEVILLIIIIL